MQFLGIALLVWLVCGIYDVSRNRPLTGATVKRYFLGNGLFTWILSPFNTLLDLCCLPFINKGIYQLSDLPPSHQAEIQKLIDTAHQENLIGQLETYAQNNARTMMFFKWYGKNVENPITIPAYHESFRYIQTIGVSVFNKRQSTSTHYGPLRATLRVLYNVNDMTDKTAFIEVGGRVHYWQDQKLFIFDDTLQHKSVNDSEKVRYCLFVDILRPCLLPVGLGVLVRGLNTLLKGVNNIFYKNWKVVKS